ncbi:MAG: helix-turn-helix transcriptional regulator [Planctomycetes bacterium]|nr:helix-turn-helix transcriptional regulator [Planctomycetota bacterium]
MANLGVKLYYLRTRERALSQQAAADALGIRQATLSHLERGRSLPNHELLKTCCEFYDVTPTFLLDDARGVVPRPTERWTLRDAIVTVGMTVEAARSDVEPLGDDRTLVHLAPGAEFFDAEAAAIRRSRFAQGSAALEQALRAKAHHERRLERELLDELDEHPRRRTGAAAIRERRTVL